MSFQETGNKIPVTHEDLIKYCQYKLAQFDIAIATNKDITPNPNPYLDNLIYETEDGKTVMVPEEIQKEAIDMWRKRKNQPKKQIIKQQQYPQKTKKNYIVLIIWILVALLSAYFFFRSNTQAIKVGLDTEKLTYYLTKK